MTPMLGGSIVQLLTGGALVAARRADDLAVLGAKMGVKAGVAALVLVAAAAAVVWQRRLRSSGSGDGRVRPLLFIAGLAAIANVVIAVFWT